MPGVLFCCLVHQAHRGGTLAWALLCSFHIRHLKKQPGLGSCSVVQCIRHLMGQTLNCSTANAGVWGERDYGAGFTPMCDSAVSPCFHGCLAFLHRHFPPQSPPSYPISLSLHSQQKPSPWDCSTVPKLQLPAAAASRGPASLSRVRVAAARTV